MQHESSPNPLKKLVCNFLTITKCFLSSQKHKIFHFYCGLWNQIVYHITMSHSMNHQWWHKTFQQCNDTADTFKTDFEEVAHAQPYHWVLNNNPYGSNNALFQNRRTSSAAINNNNNPCLDEAIAKANVQAGDNSNASFTAGAVIGFVLFFSFYGPFFHISLTWCHFISAPSPPTHAPPTHLLAI